MTMRRRPRLFNMAFVAVLALTTVLVAVPAMAATSTTSWDFSRGLDVIPGAEVEIAGLTHVDVPGSECTVDLESDNGLSVHPGHNLNLYVNGALVLTLEGIEDESFKMNSGSAGFVSTGSDDVVVFLESTRARITSSTGTLTVTCTPPPPTGGQGCTPGYWKQAHHFDSWVGYAPGDEFDVVFGVPYDVTLLEALKAGGGDEMALGRHAVAALLNASSGDVSYGFTEADVIALVQNAWATGDFETAKDLLADENELGCPLN